MKDQEIKATFLQFASGLAAQTLMHLGMLENPMTNTTDIDLPNAKYSVDLLILLKEKTKGNLTVEESTYLNAAIDDLKIRYAQVAERSEAEDK